VKYKVKTLNNTGTGNLGTNLPQWGGGGGARGERGSKRGCYLWKDQRVEGSRYVHIVMGVLKPEVSVGVGVPNAKTRRQLQAPKRGLRDRGRSGNGNTQRELGGGGE